MPELDPTLKSTLEARQGTGGHILLWLVARNRDTGEDEALGFWTGDDHRTFTIDGEARTYFGAGAVISGGPIRAGIGLDVRYQSIMLPPMTDEARNALRVYQPRGARVQVHVVNISPDTGLMTGAPVPMVDGFLEQAPESHGKAGGDAQVELKIASYFRRLTDGVPLYKSDEALKARAPGDRGREYAGVVGDWKTPWGETKGLRAGT